MPVGSSNNEKALSDALREGDVNAFNLLYLKYDRKIYYNLKKLVHLEDVALELHQDVFLKVWLNRDKINSDFPFESFLVTIAKNIAIDFYRRVLREKKLMDRLINMTTEIYDPVTDFMENKALGEIIEESINKLPPKRQIVFRLIKLENKSYEFVANELGVSVGTIKDHMAKASAFLKAEISKYDSELLVLSFISLIRIFQK
ncbi:sigma-70 family RNA polymerase sigma factor [Pedobacter riviphilus]|uniref:Sigma-70 family RNA polymerase sigma factor n=1 Tax=Pedobacter riviphilus TaxID=2766984 RepID=A0ABX6THZ2_9SPHI|nr:MULTISPECIES: sigma-70 family RNA polymerase sigma factor [Pedobacter]NII81141.1 RNA polymerase sigma-70 factor (ECF subfamily) [Pedobacter sp. SG908]NMN35158.1 RNA polymerase sigma-70 factor (ECF subfamily) [Pedobacter sp. SG918]QNR85147.1 sigma-70 family RNA polymerase sigma factor [Pedobacter riviphilus]